MTTSLAEQTTSMTTESSSSSSSSIPEVEGPEEIVFERYEEEELNNEENNEEEYDDEDGDLLDEEMHSPSKSQKNNNKSKKNSGDRFVIKFISAVDIPSATDFRTKADPFLRAHICVHQTQTTHDNRTIFKLKRISEFITTHRRLDCNNAVWNCFRDFRITPPDDAILTVECLQAADSSKPDVLLGKVDIPIVSLRDGDLKTFFFLPFKGNRQKNPKFSVNLQRVWMNEEPPRVKTFFLIRHGESKWNKAQSSIDIPGLLDRDHPLTDVGIQQAEALNAKWKQMQKLPRYQLHHFTLPPATSPKRRGSNSGSVVNTPEKKNYATANLLDLDDYDEPKQSPSATPQRASDSASCKSTIDFFSDNFLLSQLAGGEDEDELNADTIDSSSDDDDEDGEDGEDDEEKAAKGIALCGRRLGEEESETEPDEGDTWREVEKETALNRNADFLVKAFHEEDIDIAEKEAAEKRHEGYVRLFLHADRVYSSPLTRAFQTALLSMEGHRAVESHGYTLYSIIREVRRIGGLDTMGVEIGDGVERRTRTELAAYLGPQRAHELLDYDLHVNDADQMWWTPMSSHDTEKDQQERITEFLTFSRYCDSKIPVFVGHSLFFKAFYCKRVSTKLLINRRQLSENLKRFRLSNASMLAVTVAYKTYTNGQSEAVMLDADLIFGGGFHAHKTRQIRRDSFINQLGTSPTVFGLAANIQSELRNKSEQLSNVVNKFSEKLNYIFDK